MATEDTAALTEYLRLVQASDGRVTLPHAMKLFEDIRIPQTEMVRDASLHAGKVLHLSAGRECEERDVALHNNRGPSEYRKDLSLEDTGKFIFGCRYGIVDNTVRDWCYGYDVVDDVQERWWRTFGT